MEKSGSPLYHSTTVLGQLYDKVEPPSVDLNINAKDEITFAQNFPYRMFIVDKYKEYEVEAKAIESEYNRELKRLMRQYGIKHEQEVISGYILKFYSKQYAKQAKLFDIRKEITHAYRIIQDKQETKFHIRKDFLLFLISRYLQLFWREFYEGEENEEETTDKVKWSKIVKELKWYNQVSIMEFFQRNELYGDRIKQKASAWFMAAYQPFMIYLKRNCQRIHNPHPQSLPKYNDFLSFGWLVYPILLQIYKEKKPGSQKENRKNKRRNKKKNKAKTTKTTTDDHVEKN